MQATHRALSDIQRIQDPFVAGIVSMVKSSVDFLFHQQAPAFGVRAVFCFEQFPRNKVSCKTKQVRDSAAVVCRSRYTQELGLIPAELHRDHYRNPVLRTWTWHWTRSDDITNFKAAIPRIYIASEFDRFFLQQHMYKYHASYDQTTYDHNVVTE